VLQTERLVLRAWRAEDREPFAAINADAEVMRWIGSGRVLGRGLSDELIDRFEREWEARGFGLWAVAWRDAADGGPAGLLGFCGLTAPAFLPEVLPALEIGWRLARDAWGRGVATEAARAALAFGFERCGMREILALVAPENVRSLRVAAKLGMTPRPDRYHAGAGRRVRVLGLDADGYNGGDTSTRGRQASTWSVSGGWSRAEVPEAS
jgi:RimJ/RimL family protein N-acetyltransferase